MTSSYMKDKPYKIDKRQVYKAYKAVKSNQGAAGVDGQTLEQFETDWKRNLYKIWNRMSSGTYFPPPVRAVSIPKKSGGDRILGVPTVSDRIAQVVVKQLIETEMESVFLPDSYGYRPGKSALDAVGVTRERCWKYDWVLEFDIKGLFDNIDHVLLLKAVRKHVTCDWALLYIERWLTAPMEREGVRMERTRGTPQGGVISPILANLFLHYTFDLWMKRTYPDLLWCRYADDGLVHCRTPTNANYDGGNRSRLNPLLRGWIEYYGRFTPSALEPIYRHVNLTLLRWARRKFKRFAVRPTQAGRFLEELARKPDAVFVHWRFATNGWFA